MNLRFQQQILIIEKCLKIRLRDYPERKKESFEQLSNAINDFGKMLREDLDFDSFQPDVSIINRIENISMNPIFICGAMKSGTTLLTQLLDNHPDLFVLPGDSHYVNKLNWLKNSNFESIMNSWLHRMINPTGKEPFWFLGPEIKEIEVFSKYLFYCLKNYRHQDHFLSIVTAIFAAIHVNSDNKKYVKHWVEKTPGNEFKVSLLNKRYPKSKFIHIIRNPLENIVSLEKLTKLRKRNTTMIEHSISMKNGFKVAKKNLTKFGKKRYHIIRYEDLVSNPKEVLTNLCRFLEINFHDALLIPTENGSPAMSNSMFKENRLKGEIVNLSKEERYKSFLSNQQINNIVDIIYKEALYFDYHLGDNRNPFFRVINSTRLHYQAAIQKVKRQFPKNK